MKHGGHKDLIELVSLAKIERELSVRGNFKIDLLEKERKNDQLNRSGPVATANTVDRRRLEPNAFQSTMALMKQKSTAALTQITRLTLDKRFFSLDAMMQSQNEPSLAVDGNENEVETDEDLRVQAVRNAMRDMQKRIPAFRMVYISPMHLRCRQEELIHNTYRTSRSTPKQRSSFPGVGDPKTRIEAENSMSQVLRLMGRENEMNGASTARRHTSGGLDLERQARTSTSSVTKIGRRIDLFGSDNTNDSFVRIKPLQVDLCFGGSYCLRDISGSNVEDESSCNRSIGTDGYSTLMNFVEVLRAEQEEREWKFTLAQQTIGQSRGIDGKMQSAPTASSLLAQGKLKGPLLQRLIDSQLQVIRNLQLLTMPEETGAADAVRDEYEKIILVQVSENRIVSAEEVSNLANDFVGKAIHKNFNPNGRFAMLGDFGQDLRNETVHLKPKEVIPAKHLETLFFESRQTAESAGRDSLFAVDATFDAPFQRLTADESGDHFPVFASGLDQWQSLLRLSLSVEHPNATSRIWNAGLSDGGLHNMFLSEDGEMWLFDLGEPCLQTIPSFLTKFLMSFFHTLGMEEDETGDWVVRFEQDGSSGRLRPTERTVELQADAIRAFNVTVDRIVAELFDGADGVRILLLRYVVTQLVSDAAFCIEKWRLKGGGDELRSDHQDNLEKWLWRALWDVYVSEELRRRYLAREMFTRQAEVRDLGYRKTDLRSVQEG